MRHLAWITVLATSIAHADERGATVNIGAGYGATNDSPMVFAPGPMFDTRLTLAWENAPLSYAAAPALLLDFDLVPELLVGAFVRDDRAEGYFGAGVRAELKAANNRNRILNTRGSVYLAARGLVVGDPQLAMVELAFGQFYMIGAQARFGFELAMQVARTDTMDETGTELAFMSGVFAIYVGWMR